MSSRHSRSKTVRPARPTVTQLLGTNEPGLQAEAVQNLLVASKVQSVYVLITFNLIERTGQVIHSPGMPLEQYNHALDLAHQYGVRQQIEMEKQATPPAEEPVAVPGQPFPDPPIVNPGDELPAPAALVQGTAIEGGNHVEGASHGLESYPAADA